MASENVSLTAGELRIANVANLEAELSALWQSAAEGTETRQPVTRASVLTLLAYAESEEAGAETLKLIGEITQETPCRAIVMVADRAASHAQLRASVSARCRIPTPGERQICCEVISLYASGPPVEGLKSLVIPLIIPELPVYLWWRGSDFAPPACLGDILRVTDRVLVDSSAFPDVERGFTALAQQLNRVWGARRLAFSDLNWTRLTPWRELLAQCFEFPEAVSCLHQISRIRLEWGKDAGTRWSAEAAAWLLAAWLASRLNWQPKKAARTKSDGRVLTFDCNGQPVEVTLEPAVGLTLSVSIETRGPVAGVFRFMENPAAAELTGHCTVVGRPPFVRRMPLAATKISQVISHELRFPSRDLIYEQVLDTLARVLALPY